MRENFMAADEQHQPKESEVSIRTLKIVEITIRAAITTQKFLSTAVQRIRNTEADQQKTDRSFRGSWT